MIRIFLLSIAFPAFFSAAIITGTGSHKATLKQKTDKVSNDTAQYATFYIYRKKRFQHAVTTYMVNVGDTAVGRVKSNSKYVVKIYKEGALKVWSRIADKESALTFNVTFGKSYYIKCGIDVGFSMSYSKLEEVYADEGQADWEKIKNEN